MYLTIDPNIIRPLIASPSPRDLEEFKKGMESVENIDKLFIKYTPSAIAYPRIRREFLENRRNYTHLIICPDDLVLEPEKLQIIIDNYQYNNVLTQEEKDRTIITGYCNVNARANAHQANICTEPVSPNRGARKYQWLLLESLRQRKAEIDNTPELYVNKRNYLLPVKFAGFPLPVIPRSIIEQIDFVDDASVELRQSGGYCWDVMYCYNSLQKGYQLFTDLRVELLHLKQTMASNIGLEEQQKRFRRQQDTPQEQKPHFYYQYAALDENTTNNNDNSSSSLNSLQKIYINL